MAPRLRSATLESRTSRLRLKVRGKPYFLPIAPGINLGYRRNLGPGAWLVRCADGAGGSWSKGLDAVADDFEDADGTAVLTFWDAQVRAREMVRGKATDATKPITVAEALDEHEIDLRTRGGLVGPLRRVRDRLSPALLARPVGLLVMRELRHWRDGELGRGLKPASVTRLCKAFAAALNFVADHDPSIGNRAAWRIGLAALPDSQVARSDTILSDDEVRAVVAACYAIAPGLVCSSKPWPCSAAGPFRRRGLLVGDLQADRILMPSSAKGRGRKRIDRRPLPLPAALAAKLRIAAGDRNPRRRCCCGPTA